MTLYKIVLLRSIILTSLDGINIVIRHCTMCYGNYFWGTCLYILPDQYMCILSSTSANEWINCCAT